MPEDETEGDLQSQDTFAQELNAAGLGLKKKTTFMHMKILPEQEIIQVKNKFMDGIEFLYDEAIARHKNISTTKIPVVMWVLLVWFASDNVIGWLSSPILFYPIILLAGVLVILFQLGILPILWKLGLPMAKDHTNGLLEKANVPFRF